MDLFRYKKSEVISPKTLAKHCRRPKKMPRRNIELENFIGKFRAKEEINSVKLKQDFKRGIFN